MSHIYIYSPSGAVRDRAAFRRGVKRLQAMGHEVEIDPDALASFERFAGDDATRLAAIGRAAASGADVALITRGGYGLTRLLPDLPYRALARAADKGTHFVGLSDFTALQLALLAKTGATTWAGPALLEGFGAADATDAGEGHGGHATAGGPDEIMLACFDDLVSGVGEGTGWRLPAVDVAALVGAPYFPEVKGGVLFLEDVAEHPYRVERMLAQMLHAGVLARQKAIVLGQFTEYKLTPHDRGYSMKKVVDWLRGQLPRTPVLTGLPFGHVPTKVLLPVGAKVDLLVEERDALVLWGHMH